jgi:DNA polymerase III delta prime subunit
MNEIIKKNEIIKQKPLNIHKELFDKLDYFIDTFKIPHIIFYGNAGSGKKHILNKFINKIYKNNKEEIKKNVMYVNCAHSKGIRFIRDELKFFAKINIQNYNGKVFKSIILFNAEKLTMDAQSALRRCIEQFSHNTRFFIIVENIETLLKPILSRFCNIYIPSPNIKSSNLHIHHYQKYEDFKKKRLLWLKNKLNTKKNTFNLQSLITFINTVYEKGYSALDIIEIIKDSNNEKKYDFLFYFDKIRIEFRNEKVLMFIYCYYFFMRKNINLENILTM